MGPRNDFFGLFIKGKKSFKFDNKGLKIYPKIVSDSVFKKKMQVYDLAFIVFIRKIMCLVIFDHFTLNKGRYRKVK